MRSGKLKHRIQVQQRQSGQDSLGQPLNGWQTVLPCWAEVKPLRGRERYAHMLDKVAQPVQSEVEAIIHLRYRDGIAPTMRVLHGGVVYNIEAVIDVDAAGVELELMCSAGKNDG